MSDIAIAIGRALHNMLHPRMWLLMIWPTALATLLWGVLAYFFGAQVFHGAQDRLAGLAVYQHFADTWPVSLVATVLIYVLMAIVFVPLVLITASLIIGVFSMPLIVHHVAQRDFPALERREGGSFAGSLGNAGVAIIGLLLLALISLPLWLIPVLWPLIPIILFAWFNQRLFRYDALSEHASRDELRTVFKRYRGQCWLLGVVLAVIGHIPVVGFFMPVLGGLAFTHFGLRKLTELRGQIVALTPVNPLSE